MTFPLRRCVSAFALAVLSTQALQPVLAQQQQQPPLSKAKKAQPIPPPLPPTAYALEDALPGLKFDNPLGIATAPGMTDRLFIIERPGRIQLVTDLGHTPPARQVFLDLTAPRDGKLTSEGECGLLGFALHPDHANNRRFFVYYSVRMANRLYERVSRFEVSKSNPLHAEPTSEQPLFTQEDPAINHNGGDLHFGPDGYLYISVGDGGAGDDKFNEGRFINQGFHAAILRIDVDQKPGNLPPNPHSGIARDPKGDAYYSVPADNPFVGAASHHGQSIPPESVRTEIWACGLRNVWRFSFDPKTHRLFAGDVGQNLYEEVDLIVKGGDYGWSYREGLHPFTTGPGGAAEPPEFKPIDPIFEYPRTTGTSVTGGVVYHGTRYPELQGAYICADYAFGRIMALRERQPQWAMEIIAVETGIVALGADPRDGEILFANLNGNIRKLKKQ